VTDPYVDLAESFVDHYATLRGAVRQALVAEQVHDHLPVANARVCDVGGGAGHQAIPLARAGHHVVVVDPSEEMLDRLAAALDHQPAAVAARVTSVLMAGEDAPAQLGAGGFDAVLCHGVLMYLDDPRDLVHSLVRLARPGGMVSLLAKNASALALRPALQGRWEDAVTNFDAVADVGNLGAVTRGDTVESLTDVLDAAGADVVAWYGVRVLTDHRTGEPVEPDFPLVLEAEKRAAATDPYRQVGRLIHLVASRR
jgi:SAM-dependent methyltransferase